MRIAINRGDFEEVPEHVRKGLRVHFASRFDDVVPLLFREQKPGKSGKPRQRSRTSKAPRPPVEPNDGIRQHGAGKLHACRNCA